MSPHTNEIKKVFFVRTFKHRDRKRIIQLSSDVDDFNQYLTIIRNEKYHQDQNANQIVQQYSCFLMF